MASSKELLIPTCEHVNGIAIPYSNLFFQFQKLPLGIYDYCENTFFISSHPEYFTNTFLNMMICINGISKNEFPITIFCLVIFYHSSWQINWPDHGHLVSGAPVLGFSFLLYWLDLPKHIFLLNLYLSYTTKTNKSLFKIWSLEDNDAIQFSVYEDFEFLLLRKLFGWPSPTLG